VIQIQSITIRELRGIRELTIHTNGKSFVISGPNGSGKSGVVDAIQFGLTGDISRLSGKGTVGLTVQRHGPHVDKRDDPEAAEVSLTLLVPDTGKTVVLKRNVKTAKTFTLTPEDPKVRALLEEVTLHPELTLSRREIIKYILVEAGERSKEIQTLLKLDDVGEIRGILPAWRRDCRCFVEISHTLSVICCRLSSVVTQSCSKWQRRPHRNGKMRRPRQRSRR